MAGEELLIADGIDRDREGLRKLFDDQGFVCTGCGDVATAQELVRRKFFPVAVIDLDFGSTAVPNCAQSSRSTIADSGRRSGEPASSAMRTRRPR